MNRSGYHISTFSDGMLTYLPISSSTVNPKEVLVLSSKLQKTFDTKKCQKWSQFDGKIKKVLDVWSDSTSTKYFWTMKKVLIS